MSTDDPVGEFRRGVREVGRAEVPRAAAMIAAYLRGDPLSFRAVGPWTDPVSTQDPTAFTWMDSAGYPAPTEVSPDYALVMAFPLLIDKVVKWLGADIILLDRILGTMAGEPPDGPPPDELIDPRDS